MFVNKNFAPSGYGYGGPPPAIVLDNDADGTAFDEAADAFLADMNDYEAKQIQFRDYPFLSGTYFAATIYKRSADYAVIHAVNYEGLSVDKIKYNGVWKPWMHENPLMVFGTEYLTTERINAKAVYKKADSNGHIMRRLNGEDEWKYEAPYIVKLWENASPTSSFAAQKISLDLSAFDHLIIYGSYQNDTIIVGPATFIKVGLNGVLHASAGLAENQRSRRFETTTTGVDFSTGCQANNGNVSAGACIPMYIFGVKGVS